MSVIKDHSKLLFQTIKKIIIGPCSRSVTLRTNIITVKKSNSSICLCLASRSEIIDVIRYTIQIALTNPDITINPQLIGALAAWTSLLSLEEDCESSGSSWEKDLGYNPLNWIYRTIKDGISGGRRRPIESCPSWLRAVKPLAVNCFPLFCLSGEIWRVPISTEKNHAVQKNNLEIGFTCTGCQFSTNVFLEVNLSKIKCLQRGVWLGKSDSPETRGPSKSITFCWQLKYWLTSDHPVRLALTERQEFVIRYPKCLSTTNTISLCQQTKDKFTKQL